MRRFPNVQSQYLVCDVPLLTFIYSCFFTFSGHAWTLCYSSRCSLDMFSALISLATAGDKCEFDTNTIIVANGNILHATFA